MGKQGSIIAADEAVTLDDMGDGSLTLSQFNETSGRVERVVIPWEDMAAMVEALRWRYG